MSPGRLEQAKKTIAIVETCEQPLIYDCAAMLGWLKEFVRDAEVQQDHLGRCRHAVNPV